MRGWMANLVGAAAGVLVVGTGLVVGAPLAEADAPSNRAVLGNAPGGEQKREIPLGQAMELWGQPAQVSLFWTNDTREQIVGYYVRTWQEAGLEAEVKDLDKVSHVAALEPKTGLLRGVTVLDQGDERIVLPSVVDARVLPDLSAKKAPVPVPENARGYLAQVADDSTSLSYHASFLLPLRPETATAFYRHELAPLGYQESPESKKLGSSKAEIVEFTRGPEWVSIVATPTEEKSRETSFVVVTHVRALDEAGAAPKAGAAE